MLSTQIIAETLACIKKETGVRLCVYTPTDLVVTEDGVTSSERFTEISAHLSEETDPGRYDGHWYFHLKDSGTPRLLLECDTDDKSFVVGKMAALQFKMLLSMDEDRYDTDNFFKNLLLDNLLAVDIYSRANTFRIDTKAKRVAFLIEVSGHASGEQVEFIRSLLDDLERNYVTALSENVDANLLGLGNAVTPAGIRAAKGLRRLGARAELNTLVVMNTASVQLLPTTAASLRAALGSRSPFDITPAVWLSSALALMAGLAVIRVLNGRAR